MTGESAPATVAAKSAATDAPEVVDGPKHVTLGEFCSSLSVYDKRVELIAGFHSDEKLAGRLFGTETAYQERFLAFADRPVK